MEKPHDMDDIALLSCRFEALMSKLQGLISEMQGNRSPGAMGPCDRSSHPAGGHKAYTIQATDSPSGGRQRALVKVIDDVLRQIDHAVTSGGENPPSPDMARRALLHYEKRLFTSEELNFLEKTLRTFHPSFPDGTYSDR